MERIFEAGTTHRTLGRSLPIILLFILGASIIIFVMVSAGEIREEETAVTNHVRSTGTVVPRMREASNTVFVRVPKDEQRTIQYTNHDWKVTLDIPSSWQVAGTPERIIFTTDRGTIVMTTGELEGRNDGEPLTLPLKALKRGSIAGVMRYTTSQDEITYVVKGRDGRAFTFTVHEDLAGESTPYLITIFTLHTL